nr:FkbM family methyltransferase [uncultured Rhodopila sp.]
MKLRQLDVGGQKVFIRANTADEIVAKNCLGDEFDLVSGLLEKITRRNTVLDLGGYIGTAAIRFATAIPHCTVITVEPSPENFRILQLNTMKFPNIIAVNAAVGTAAGKMQLYARTTGESGHTLVQNPKDCTAPTKVSTVDVVPVREFLERYSPPTNTLSLVKIDIEGGEVDLLRDHGWIDGFAIALAELHDRIIDGCTAAWLGATRKEARFDITDNGEKSISVNPAILHALHAVARPDSPPNGQQ